ncbi:Armadillo-type fold containing protein [Thalictrum thalictroides]|uniref:Armadillo-type fold containing protein n=1 Tax=Thalictrum thalictroides TaxID=46969 RepID=A0A7J6UY25_THATH|nr:Armadillo-type fold containing protein [Thalictrum thalictroides]
MFYHVADESVKAASNATEFLDEQVDLLGGIEFICIEYSQANSREEKRNLFLVLLDYALHHINEACVAAGYSEYSNDEIQLIATTLSLSDAPEAFCISVKHGVQGIGELIRGSISAALSRYPNKERLNMLLEKVTKKLEIIISAFSHLDEEFSDMIWMTKLYNSLTVLGDGSIESIVGMKAKQSWATLHSLLHSERIAYRQNGYIWLVELLLTEINEEKDKSKKQNIWSSIKKLQLQIGLAGSKDHSNDLEVSLPIWILCGLLKSKHNIIRWGFLFVIEKLLMRCKLLLDENELQDSGSSEVVGYDHGDSRLEKANAVIDILSSALSLVAQINETDRINILKMCDMLFSQLCLRLFSATEMSLGDAANLDKVFGCTEKSEKGNEYSHVHQERSDHTAEFPDEIDSMPSTDHNRLSICKTASLAALLLQGQAIVPMQLVSRVPTALLYWPLIQLAGAAADDIALGVAVGSKGRGNLPGAASDIRAALLLLLIGKCTADSAAFQEVGGEEFFRELLDDTDSRVAYYCSAFLLKKMMTEEPETYQRMLQSLIFRAQQSNNEKLLENPYLQIRGILQLSNDLGTGL